MNLFSTDLSIVWPALVAGILVVISHVPLGQQVFSRGIVFIDLAIAQVAGLGVIVASGFGLPVDGWPAQAAAGIAALAGALLLTWTEKKRPEAQEALIGILFVLASAMQILVLANDPHGGENLKDLLSGQILWVSNAQLVRTAILTAVFAAIGELSPLTGASLFGAGPGAILGAIGGVVVERRRIKAGSLVARGETAH